MQPTFDVAELRELDLSLAGIGRSFDARTAGATLLNAAKPMLVTTRQEAPVGRVPKFKSATVVRGRRKGQARTNTGSYQRGGATRRDVRLKVVPGVGDEVARVLSGVDKRHGHVGWRAHLGTRGTRKQRADDWLSRAESRTVDIVISRLGTSAQLIVRRALTRYAR